MEKIQIEITFIKRVTEIKKLKLNEEVEQQNKLKREQMNQKTDVRKSPARKKRKIQNRG